MIYIIILMSIIINFFKNRKIYLQKEYILIYFLGISNFLSDLSIKILGKDIGYKIDGLLDKFTLIIIVVNLLIILKNIKDKKVTTTKYGLFLIVFSFMWFFIDIMSSTWGLERGFYKEGIYFSLVTISVLLIGDIKKNVFLNIVNYIFSLYVYVSFIFLIFSSKSVIQENYLDGFLGPLTIRYTGILEHSNGFGYIITLFIIINFFYRSKNRNLNIIISIISLILTQSKTNILSLIFVIIAVLIMKFLLNIKSKYFKTVIISSFAILAIITVTNINKINSMVTSIDINGLTTLTGRTAIWKDSIKIWSKNKDFGYGPMVFNETNRKMWYGEKSERSHSHNQFVQTLVQNGIVGEIVLIVFFAVAAWVTIKAIKGNNYIGISILMAILIKSISESPLILRSININLFTMIIFIVISYLEDKERA